MNELTFITGNTQKAAEAQAILPFPIRIHPLDLNEIQSLDTEKIIQYKANQAHELVKTPLFVDDVSLQITAWNGFPGPLVKFLLQDGNALLMHLLEPEEDRSATLSATIGYHDGKTIHTFQGVLPGMIAKAKDGSNGWGFDPIFIPDGSDKTFAQMSPDEKNTLSHRKKALTLFAHFLSKNLPA